ncbi:MAG: PAS domain-containing sensor histidine kinase [Chitinophagaceae bacterium]|nr:MAG: PAS domain-containing sensor histidine kinase [Chitinophagaceae bacterium]
MQMQSVKYKELQSELDELRRQLSEANETIEAIRTGQVDALVVEGSEGHQLYTLKSADHTYRVFIEKMNEGAVTLDKDGVIMYCNSSFAQMARGSISNVIGLPFTRFLTESSVPVFEELFANCWAQDCKGELQLKSEPLPIPVHLSLTALEVQDGVSLSMILTDLTMIKETEKELKKNYLEIAATNHALEASNHDLQQFASVASHDLQEPGVRGSGGESFHLKTNGDPVAVGIHPCMKQRIVPRVTRGRAAFAIRTFRISTLQLRIDILWIPAEAEGDVADVHSEISHNSNLATLGAAAFPVGGFGGVQIA